MKPKTVFFILLLSCLLGVMWLPSCKDEPFEYQIERASVLSFRLDTFDIVSTTEVVFYEGPFVLHEFSDTLQVLYQRISLQAHGVTPASTEFWLIVDFDTHADGDAVGLYTSNYNLDLGGIAEMRLIILKDGEYLEFETSESVNSVFFQVDAQKQDERIMKGIFGGTLFRDGGEENQVVFLTDGEFKDIYY